MVHVVKRDDSRERGVGPEGTSGGWMHPGAGSKPPRNLALARFLARIGAVFLPAARCHRLNRAGFLLRMWAVWVALTGLALPAARSADAAKFSYDVWEVGEGLEQDAVTSVIQSHDGYLWLGTYTGLRRFDGVRVTLFDAANTPGLKNSRVTSLSEDANGVIWIGHESGDLTRLSDGEFQPAGRAPGWPGGAVEGIATDDQGDVWVLSDTGLLIRMKDGKPVEPPGGASPSRKVYLS